MSTIPFEARTSCEARPQSILGTVDALLRDRAATQERIREGDDLAGFARAMLATIAVGAGSFGGAMGAWRGGLQIVLAGVKLPLVVLFTAALCAPAASALNAAFDRRSDARRDIALVLASLALGSLVLAALAPVLLLADTLGVSYHAFILAIVGCCAIGGLAGVILLVRGLAADGARLLPVSLGLLAVFALVGSQLAWSGRPWVTRPRTSGVVVLRAVDDQSFLDSVARSLDSAAGNYSREQAPVPGEE
ncbi:MAG TPA: hypothetical protein VMV18_06310 [bacterium]|nr:hypothetical protein [bacterium]